MTLKELEEDNARLRAMMRLYVEQGAIEQERARDVFEAACKLIQRWHSPLLGDLHATAQCMADLKAAVARVEE